MNRGKLNKRLNTYIERYKDKSQIKRKVMAYMLKEHNVMAKDIAYILSQRTSIEDQDDLMTASLFLAFVKCTGDNINIHNYIDEKELEECNEWKATIKAKIQFPLEFRAIQVSDDQWIGRTTLKELMNIKSLITYDTEAQRPMTRRVVRGEEKYEITLNASAVEAIRESMENETYIPNTITLNIPIDIPDKTVSYDEKECILSFNKSFTQFNILDGYHRYVAMEIIHATNAAFDMPMEIRFTKFPLGREQQFIYQEDQKTKMKKVSSNSFNQNSAGTQITSMLNADMTCMLSGLIKRNNGIIDFGVFANGINGLFIKSNDISKAKIIATTSRIKETVNAIIMQDPSILDEKWSWKFTYALLVCVAENDTNLDHIRKLSKEFEENWTEKIGGNEDASKRRLTKAVEFYREIF